MSAEYDATFVARHFPRKPDVAYLDTASVGLVPATVLDRVRAQSESFERGLLGSPDWNRDVAPLPDAVREAFALDPAVATTLMSSTGEALNAVAYALEQPGGSHVLAFGDEFPTVHLPFQGAGWELRTLEAPADGDRTAALVDAITERTDVVAVSHVHAATGEVVDLDRLRAAADRVGAYVVVDGAHGAGVVPFSMRSAHVYAATGYKWLTAGFGHCLLLTSGVPLRPRLLGHGNVPPSRDLRVGHENLGAALALLQSFAVRREYGQDRIAARVAALTGELIRRFQDAGLDVRPTGERAGIVSVGGLASGDVVARLRERGTVAAARWGYVRFSPWYYTSDDEVDRAATDLLAVVRP
jgi:selenocysteine lyase/cysteine desulfurase